MSSFKDGWKKEENIKKKKEYMLYQSINILLATRGKVIYTTFEKNQSLEVIKLSKYFMNQKWLLSIVKNTNLFGKCEMNLEVEPWFLFKIVHFLLVDTVVCNRTLSKSNRNYMSVQEYWLLKTQFVMHLYDIEWHLVSITP